MDSKPSKKPPVVTLVAAAVAVMVMLHGVRLQAEQTIHHMALLAWLHLAAACRA